MNFLFRMGVRSPSKCASVNVCQPYGHVSPPSLRKTVTATRMVLMLPVLLGCARANAQQASSMPPHESLAVASIIAADADQAVDLDRVIVTGTRPAPGYGADSSSTATKSDLPILKTPQAVVVIPQQVLEDFQPVFLDDSLRTVSGINQTNTFGNTSDGVTIRGFQPSDYFRNGVRSLSNRNLTPSTERIEVLKGPSSLLYGSVEPGGLINVVTKRPLFDADFSDIEYQASDRGGNRLGLDTGATVGSARSGELAYRLIVDRDRSDYWRNFGENDNTFIAPSLSWRTPNLHVSAAYEFQDIDGPFDRGTVVVGDRIADIPQTRRLGERFERLTETINLGELDLDYDLSTATTVRLRASYQNNKGSDLQARPRRVTVDSEGNPVLVRRVDGTFDRYAENRYFSASVLHRFQTGPLTHQLLVGADHERSKNGRAGFVQGPDERPDQALDIFDPVYGMLDPNGVVPIATGRSAGNGDATGAYLQDVIDIGSMWTALLGGRFETYDSISRTENVTEPTLSDDSTFLPRAGLVFMPRSWISLYLSYSQSFTPNVFTPADFAPGSPTAFDPEEGVSREAGLKLQWDRVNVTAAWFDIEKRNVLQVENLVPRLIDTATVQGFELDVAGEITPAWSMIAAYAYQDSDDGEGRSITNVARHTVGLTTTYRWLEGALRGASAGISAQYVGDRDGGRNPSASPGGPEFFTVPQYMVADLFVAYELPTALGPLRLQLNLKNAFDEVYFPSSGGSLRINPGQSRTLYATAALRF